MDLLLIFFLQVTVGGVRGGRSCNVPLPDDYRSYLLLFLAYRSEREDKLQRLLGLSGYNYM